MYRITDTSNRVEPVRYAMIGGGPGAFFAPYHRLAARMSGQWQLVAGAFSSDAGRNHAAGRNLGVGDDRIYTDAEALVRGEAGRPDAAEAAVVVTPNHLHATACRTLLRAGLHVVCDKPLAISIQEGDELVSLAAAQERILGVTYTYLGFPMVREARARIARGDVGQVRMVYCEYLQEWLGQDEEALGAKHAAWRMDPSRAGPTGTLGDVGTHAFALSEYLAGEEVVSLNAALDTFVEGRQLDDNDIVTLRYESGARGLIWATQVAPGHRNGLRCKVIGTKASLEWCQEQPERLWIGDLGGADRILYRGQSEMLETATNTLPAGNPEGYMEALALLYDEYAAAIRGSTATSGTPMAREGARGLRFIDACLKSSRAQGNKSAL